MYCEVQDNRQDQRYKDDSIFDHRRGKEWGCIIECFPHENDLEIHASQYDDISQDEQVIIDKGFQPYDKTCITITV